MTGTKETKKITVYYFNPGRGVYMVSAWTPSMDNDGTEVKTKVSGRSPAKARRDAETMAADFEDQGFEVSVVKA